MPDCEDESPECQQDRADYAIAERDRAAIETQIQGDLTDIQKRNQAVVASGGTIAVGVALLESGVGFAIVGIGGVGLGFSLVRQWQARKRLDEDRQRCEHCRQRMQAAYDHSLTDCRSKECRPSAIIPACP